MLFGQCDNNPPLLVGYLRYNILFAFYALYCDIQSKMNILLHLMLENVIRNISSFLSCKKEGFKNNLHIDKIQVKKIV